MDEVKTVSMLLGRVTRNLTFEIQLRCFKKWYFIIINVEERLVSVNRSFYDYKRTDG